MHTDYPTLLIEGTDAQLARSAADLEQAFLVDWRDQEDWIVDEAIKRLPDGLLSYRWTDDQEDLIVAYKGHETALGLTSTSKDRYVALRGLNTVLGQDYEIRAFSISFGSDTHTFYLQSCPWWADMDARFPARMSAVFTKITDQTDF